MIMLKSRSRKLVSPCFTDVAEAGTKFTSVINRQRDIHFERAELRQDLVKRVQEAMAATERRERTEFSGSTSGAQGETPQEIELKVLGQRSAAQSQSE